MGSVLHKEALAFTCDQMGRGSVDVGAEAIQDVVREASKDQRDATRVTVYGNRWPFQSSQLAI